MWLRKEECWGKKYAGYTMIKERKIEHDLKDKKENWDSYVDQYFARQLRIDFTTE